MTEKNCLNCGTNLTGKYCSACGQKADIHRISLKHFVFHDLLHGTFHIDKGMLFTAKQALFRPGKAALDYIAGKRVNYYNVFYFILLLIGVNILLTHFYNAMAIKFDPSKTMSLKMNEVGKTIGEIFFKYGKLFVFALVPLTAFNSFLLFKRKKLNFSEHFILSGILLLGIFLITTLFFIFSFIELTGFSPRFFDLVQNCIPFLIFSYLIYGYWNAFRVDYSFLGFSYRMLLFLVLFSIELLSFVWIILGIATNWQSGTEIEFTF